MKDFYQFILENIKEDYIVKINNNFDNLLERVINNPKCVLVEEKEMRYNPIGKEGECETNVYEFIKKKTQEGESHFYPVCGYHFYGKGYAFFPVEHWWIYDMKNNINIEISPLGFGPAEFYVGVINYDINDEIRNSKEVWDIEFFKGGYGYTTYFK